MSEQRYVDLRLEAFWARRSGKNQAADAKLKQADAVWETLSAEQKEWAYREVMAQVVAKGMNTINEAYGW